MKIYNKLTESAVQTSIINYLFFVHLTITKASTRLSSEGYACRDKCTYSTSKETYLCHYRYLSSWNTLHPVKLSDSVLSLSTGHCSPVEGFDYKNRSCTSPCGFSGGTSYQWCYVNGGATWGYCSTNHTHPGTHLADFNYRGEICENNCAKYTKDYYECYNGLDGWRHCSPSLGVTSEGKECFSPCDQKGKPNIKHIKRYNFCYTDALHKTWGYCSNKKGNILHENGRKADELHTQKYDSVLHVEPPIVSWGRWHHLETCPMGMVVSGFELKSQMYMGKRYSVIGLLDTVTTLGSSPLNDDTGLNGIGLLCTDKHNGSRINSESYAHVTRIRSGWGNLGEWGKDNYCRNGAHAIGFKFKVQPPQGASDDTGATNFNLICEDKNDVPDLQLDHEPGEWSDSQICPVEQVVCGIKTKVYEDGGNEDWVGLTDVMLYCCPLTDPMTCQPMEKFETIFTFRNEFNISQKHSKEVTIGIQNSEGKEMSKKVESVQSTEIGIGGGFEKSSLKIGFETKIGVSRTTGFDWTHTTSTVWSSQITDKYDLEIPPMTEGKLLQLVGICGSFVVRTSHIVAKSKSI